jgi:glutamate 5-kinase
MGLYQNRIVVKVGTSTLTNELGKSDLRSFDRLACVLSDIQNMGYEVILVSSGAIAVGTNKLGWKTRPASMKQKQAAAAVGQCSVMFLYDKFFGDYDKTIGQILLNAEDIRQEEKKENLTNTFDALLEMGVIPIVNENDSVSYTEIESEERLFGDNDMLSAVVAILCKARNLVILSDINGLYDADPRLHPDARLIERIDRIDESVYAFAGGAGSRRGTGGMKTKLQAAALATAQGINVIHLSNSVLA